MEFVVKPLGTGRKRRRLTEALAGWVETLTLATSVAQVALAFELFDASLDLGVINRKFVKHEALVAAAVRKKELARQKQDADELAVKTFLREEEAHWRGVELAQMRDSGHVVGRGGSDYGDSGDGSSEFEGDGDYVPDHATGSGGAGAGAGADADSCANADADADAGAGAGAGAGADTGAGAGADAGAGAGDGAGGSGSGSAGDGAGDGAGTDVADYSATGSRGGCVAGKSAGKAVKELIICVIGSKGNVYTVNLNNQTCSCPQFQLRRRICKHLAQLKEGPN
jgi:hypothetical protein